MKRNPVKVLKCSECGDVFMVVGDSARIRLAFPRPITHPDEIGKKCPKHNA